MTVRPSATETETEHEPPGGGAREMTPPPDLHRLLELAANRPLLVESGAPTDADAGGSKSASQRKRETMRALRRFHHAGERPEGDETTAGAFLPASLVGWCQHHETAVPEMPARPLAAFLDLLDATVSERRRRHAEEMAALRTRLRALLDADRSKTEEGRGAEALGRQLGGVSSSFLNPTALSSTLGPHRGGRALTKEHRARIERVLETLAVSPFQENEPLATIVHDGALADDALLLSGRVALEHAIDPCAEAAARFDLRANEFASHVRAVRIGQLELAGAYDPERHGPWFANFDRRSFSREELLLVPPIVAVNNAERIGDRDMASLSHLLLSARPVHVFVFVRPMTDPSRAVSAFHLELGTLALGHREAFVHHASPGAPERLEAGFRGALGCARAVLHLLPMDRPWLLQRAALEARLHPVYAYDPERGDTWARRMDFTGNPQPEVDWPRYALACRTASGVSEEGESELELAMTPADVALLDDALIDHFTALPAEFDSDELVPVGEYLALEEEKSSQRIPFTWGIDREGRMRRLVLTRRLLAACEDRRRAWRTLQELAGVRSEYVERAVDAVRKETLAQAQAEREELEAAHREEIDRVRREAAGEAMQRLAQSLLDLDPDALAKGLTGGASLPTAPPAKTPTAAAPAAPPAGEASAAPPQAEEEEQVVTEEPYIDSELCTTCNDCTNINPRLFVYNANKQAYIGDPRAGTYAELVAAAEKCPAKCIHPGKPLDPNEPGLDDLVKRAAKFN